ncbi:MAG: DUF4190 domain-containing protein [Actinomycetota bacterium]
MSLPPPPPPGPPPYQNPYQPAYQTGADHPNGTTILVLGILSLVVCGLLGPVAWVMGNNAIREMDAQSAVNFRNRGNVTAGRICGIIGTVFLVLSVLMIVFFLVVMAGATTIEN